ncbi:hypothetical protein [Hymenobacter terricola]|uniref:hypothetical protein n=1 Tax=Hymenobacter terricola TaxID=2819236 RepID=UPI001B31092C|nr:hypothetical protein [Hymenobacter terricola]
MVPAGYEVSYERQGGKIIQDREVYVNYLLLQPRQFGSWNAVVSKLGNAYRKMLIIKKKKVWLNFRQSIRTSC